MRISQKEYVAMSGASGTATTQAAPAIRPGVAPARLMMRPTTTDDQMPTIGFTPAMLAKAIEVGTEASAVTTPLRMSLDVLDCGALSPCPVDEVA